MTYHEAANNYLFELLSNLSKAYCVLTFFFQYSYYKTYSNKTYSKVLSMIYLSKFAMLIGLYCIACLCVCVCGVCLSVHGMYHVLRPDMLL